MANVELQQIWRKTIGGGTMWDAPVYAQFFRTVRAVNATLPPARRLRVLLGDPPIDVDRVRTAADKDYALAFDAQRDAHYAAVVERESLRKGRRALLIAGGGHLRRGLRADHYPRQLNAATLLARRHPGALFVVDPLVLPPGVEKNPLVRRANFPRWPHPGLAHLAGTWLGAQRMPDHAVDAAEAVYGAQADAVLYLDPGEILTASRAEPTIYLCGDYRAQLQRLSAVATETTGQRVDYVAEGLRRARLGPGYFDGLS